MMKKLLLLVALFTLVSCSKLTLENYRQIEVGMNYDEVVNLIGSPKECNESLGTQRCIWGDEESKFVKINFINEAAVLFSHKGLD